MGITLRNEVDEMGIDEMGVNEMGSYRKSTRCIYSLEKKTLYNTVNPLYTDTRYNDKTRYNDNLTSKETRFQEVTVIRKHAGTL